ncbi:MAG TPA: Holliday junction branch migration protein RuvA [Bacteroidia bacterium]|nr:Holliday junction branch migration protein RuvA [Bacteroidia bacterium]MBP7714788.1 Holliday junction branch migration protein RuvA [Bacteroidia bacterium]MBP8668370.1 Holliday junction branch migration protein RuvA [Bacteroidia bacterium]HOZ83397.1 Holliday junction branch migration protein RuvA [Bacteroidia bacterium]HQW16553.1 Holliday junction branch migration protein RuvA [Bacteroidia bacterium]
MYDYISGKITHATATYLIVEANGVGYQLQVSLQTYSKLKDAQSAKVYTHLSIKEDAHLLFGFVDEDERQLFRHLISVSGVGPGTARVMLSSLSTSELQSAITTGNVAVIKKIKGIGDKTAQRIVIDLKDKLGKAGTSAPVLLTQGNTIKEEALSALLTLGFNRNVAEKELNKVLAGSGEVQSVEVLLREALKNL